MTYIAFASKMQAELSKMRAIVDARPKAKTRARINNLLTGYCTADDTEPEYMQLVSRVFYYRKHCSIFTTLKKYATTYFNERIGNVVGVFQSDQYIIKYDNYTDLRQLTAYKKLGFGIKRNIRATIANVDTTDTANAIDTTCANIITPIWYCIYARNDEVDNGGDNVGDDDFSESAGSAYQADNSAGDNSIVSVDKLMTLELQPKLNNSVSFHDWYNTACISMQDHDCVITKIMLSIAKSIQFCHDKNIVHGDIKPENFIVDCGVHATRADKYENKVIRRSNVPTVFLIDFGLCGTHGTDDGTGGTRPFCAPETTNVNNFSKIPGSSTASSASSASSSASALSEDDYVWCKLSKSHDVWSFGLVLFTIISYSSIFHYYKQYPKHVFDKHGYVRDKVLIDDPDISEHPLHAVFMKTLCPPDKRASIDEVIDLITTALIEM